MAAHGFESLLESFGKLAAIVLWLGIVSYGLDQLAVRQELELQAATEATLSSWHQTTRIAAAGERWISAGGSPRDTADRVDRAVRSFGLTQVKLTATDRKPLAAAIIELLRRGYKPGDIRILLEQYTIRDC